MEKSLVFDYTDLGGISGLFHVYDVAKLTAAGFVILTTYSSGEVTIVKADIPAGITRKDLTADTNIAKFLIPTTLY